MIVDLVRSFSTVPTRVIAASGQVIWGRYYLAAPGALALPFPHALGHPSWITDYGVDDPPLGVQGPVPPGTPKGWSIWQWAGKAYPAPPGQHWRGEPDWFIHGIPIPSLTNPPYPVMCDGTVMTGDGCTCGGGSGEITSLPPMGAQSVGDLVAEGSSVYVLEQQTEPSLPLTTNDYVLGGGTGYRVTSAAPATVTGFAGGVDGRLILWENYGSSLITVLQESLSSAAINRVISIDGIGTRIYPGMTASWKYDGASQRWRELSSVPLVSQQADLLTSTGTVPAVLRAGPDTSVLTADSSTLTGLKWAPIPGSAPDWFGWEPGEIGIPAYDRWQVGGFAVGDLVADVQIDSHVLYAMPLVLPQGGAIDLLAITVGIANPTPGAFCWLAVYMGGRPGNSYPTTMLGTEVQVPIDTPGSHQAALSVPASVPAGSLVWLALWSTGRWNGNCFGPGVGPTSYAWPVLGFAIPGQLKAAVGWYQGDPMGGGVDYTSGLPHGFPIPAAGVHPLGDVDVLNWPAIYAHRTS